MAVMTMNQNRRNHANNCNNVIEAYRDLLQRMPYSSVAPIYHVAGENADSRFGDNCIAQAEAAMNVAERMRCQEAYYLRDHRHHAVVAQMANERLLFDPYLLHTQPIPLDEAATNPGQPFAFCALPVVCGRRSYVEVIFHFDGFTFDLIKHRFCAQAKTYSSSRFTLDLQKAADYRADPQDPTIAFDPEQTTLSVRLVTPTTCEITHLVYPVHLHRGEQPTVENLKIKTNDGVWIPFTKREDFWNELAWMSHALRCSAKDLVEYVLHGAELYEELAPEELVYASPNPANS